MAALAAAVMTAWAGGAQAFTSSGSNAAASGAGYTLVNPSGGTGTANQALFEFALRLSQTDGSAYGKPLTLRGYGSTSTALDGFSGSKYVARSWVLSGGPWAGIPPYPGNGALITRCSLVTSTYEASFAGRAAVYLVDSGGAEHATALSFDYTLAIKSNASPDPDKNGVKASVVQVYANGSPSGLPLPFTLPGAPSTYKAILGGAAGVTDGPAPAAGTCPDTVAPNAPSGFWGSTDATGITLNWTAKDNVGVTGYRVYQDGTLVSTQAGTSWRFGPLAGGSAHTFGVEAVDAAGNTSARGSVSYLFQTSAANATVSGAGYTLVVPSVGTTVSNQALFEFSFRVVQTDGSPTGKSLTLRSYGSTTTALDGYSGGIYVARSWTLSPAVQSGVPPYPGNSALVPRCSVTWATDTASWSGRAVIYLVDEAGVEHLTSLSFDYAFAVKDYLAQGADRNGVKVGVTKVYENGIPSSKSVPFPLPGSSSAFKTILGGTAVVKPGPVPPPSACPDVTPPAAPAFVSTVTDASSITAAWSLPADDVAVSGYRLYLDGVLKWLVTAQPLRSFKFGGLLQGHGYELGVEAFDFAGNTSARTLLQMTLPDITPPVIAGMPSDKIVEAAGPDGTVVNYAQPTAEDAVAGPLDVTCEPPTDSTFPIGDTLVICWVVDPSGNRAERTFTVSVRDTSPPLIAGVPENKLIEATGPDGAPVVYAQPTATDVVDGARSVTCEPASTSIFPIGPAPGSMTTTVHCVSSDTRGNSSERTFDITVHDTTPPAFSSVPSLAPVEATGPDGAIVPYPIPRAFDLVDRETPVSCSPPPGSQFPLGYTTVTCSTSDARGNGSSIAFPVLVRDSTRPSIPSVSYDSRTTSSITISWGASSDAVGVVGYHVFFEGSLVATQTSRSFTFGGLSCGSGAYSLQVDAFDAAGNRSSRGGVSKGTAACPPWVEVTEGGYKTVSGCSSAYCHWVVVTLHNFGGGSHTVQCRDSYPPAGVYYTYTTSSTTSQVCVYGYPGYQVWAIVDGVWSDPFTWTNRQY